MRVRRPHLRATLAVKLAFVFFGAVAGALAIVYLMVVPRLEDRLVNAKVNEVERAAPSILRNLARVPAGDEVAFNDAVNDAAQNLNGRVAVLQRAGPDALLTQEDSAQLRSLSVARDPVALRAAATLETSSGRVERQGTSYAEVALPIGTSHVVLLAAPLTDALANVRLVSSALIVAGLVALAAAAAAAYAAAYGLTRRLRLLEKAADRIAAGDFSVPIETGGSDEIAELAREFDSMRLRLADLDRVRREFIANASHELRTPLFSLGGFLELMADEELDAEERREFLDETRAQVTRLTRLATDLLDLSRLDAGQIQFVKREVDLADAAGTVIDEFRVLADVERASARARGERSRAGGRRPRARASGRPDPGRKRAAAHAGGHAEWRCAPKRWTGTRPSPFATRGPESPPINRSTCSSASTAQRGARRRAPGSVSPSPESSQRAWMGRFRSRRSPETPCSP